MKKIEFLSHVNVPIESVKEKFSMDLFKALLPPIFPIKVLSFEGIQPGAKYGFDLAGGFLPFQIPPLTTRWMGEITEVGDVQGGFYFIDEGRELPFPIKTWRHLHRILPDPQQGGIDILDMVEYSCHVPLMEYTMYPSLYSLFIYRKQRYEQLLREKN